MKKSIKSRIGAVLLTVALAGGGAVATAAPAQAANAPGCVLAQYVSSKKHTFVQNQCRYNVRLKVIWAFGPDSVCSSFSNKTVIGYSPWKTFKRPNVFARFDGVKTC